MNGPAPAAPRAARVVVRARTSHTARTLVRVACVPLAGRTSEAAAREVLGAWLEVPARDVRLAHARNGRPLLAPPQDPALRVSLAHSDEWLLVALAHDLDIGVDLEHVRDGVDAAGVVAAIFPAAERKRWLATNRTRDDFFAAWVRLEALAKAAGCGLTDCCEPAALAGFEARPLAAPPGHAAAIAARGEDWAVAP